MCVITIDHSEEYAYAYYEEGVTSANNPDFWYALAMTAPRYPMPAIQYRTKYDYSDLRTNTVIGLMLGDFTHACLVQYWPA